jgi:RNA polymerase sigma-70 factor (ECF subfamily)
MVCEAILSVAESDEAARLRRREPAALADAAARYQHRLYRYLIRLVREPAAADDLYQQTWLNVLRKIGSYDARAKFDTWLFAIAHNAAMDFLRRKTGESLEDLPAEAPDGLAIALAAERTGRLEAAVAELPAVYREALTLRFEEGMKLEEIAEVMRVPLPTAKSRVHRGLEMLRRRWRKEDL